VKEFTYCVPCAVLAEPRSAKIATNVSLKKTAGARRKNGHVVIRPSDVGLGTEAAHQLESVPQRRSQRAARADEQEAPLVRAPHDLAQQERSRLLREPTVCARRLGEQGIEHTAERSLLERVGAVRVRSDVERKRLHGLAPAARTHAAPYAGIYAPEATQATYDTLGRIARDIVAAGRVAIVDAASLGRAERDRFRSLAAALGVPFVIASCYAAESTLRARVARREAAMSDASEAGVAVLENQLANEERLVAEETAATVVVDTEADGSTLGRAVDEIIARLAAGATHAPY